jgi:RNA polymerase sigma-70 factor (ECF subfamily)
MIKHLDIREEYRTSRKQDIVESQLSGEDEIIVSELEQKIRKAIDNLPIERRKVFIMSRYDGLTYNKIAEKLGISLKTVENQMGKALKTLRQELSEYLPLLIIFFKYLNL